MKNVRMILVLVLLSFGANYVLASSTWRNPTAEPPGGNADAPINVSAEGQTKEGALSILNAFDSNTLAVFGDAFFGTTVQIAGGSPGLNKVLTSDAEGVASWVDVNTLVGDGTGTLGATGGTGAAGASSYSCVSESTEPEQTKTFSAPCIDSTGSCFVTLTANQRATTGATATKEATFAFYTTPSGSWTSYPAFTQPLNPKNNYSFFVSGTGSSQAGMLVYVSGTGGCQLNSAGNGQLNLTSLNTCSQFGCATAQCNVSVCRQ